MRPPDRRRVARRSDVAAAALGFGAALCLVLGGLAALGLLSRAQCGGEARPFLGSGRQAFAIYGCLQRDAGPLIALKKRLGIYDPAWKTVIK
ncbi:hypothetical protein P7D22_20250 [Lichenihabitans sp. Uapishka_5]|uniref:hypothetical protein n=1 Tax=Lichenihabitans sp. Uapishka_5 TaxID=3037302 RepID=UPI0029E8125B|nr:hypothetical protein [Lichenihabitans sp. Uapishka_5]MDX7953500.1 hypothetical protein [Lichenihabitans sp. Uapishka_5]